jgi:hypothetical protein
MENIKRLFHGEAVSSCEVKEISKSSPNGKIRIGKKIEVVGKPVKAYCPWDCSSWTTATKGHCNICGGIVD